MLRLNPNGQIDSTFGLFGILEDPIGGRDVLCEAYDLILLPDGKITVTGYTRNPWAAVVVQYNSDGTHDTSFGILARPRVCLTIVTLGLPWVS